MNDKARHPGKSDPILLPGFGEGVAGEKAI
jgi:hypothetical protein